MRKLFLFFSIIFFVVTAASLSYGASLTTESPDSTDTSAMLKTVSLDQKEKTLIDHRATVYAIEGTVRILKRNAINWTPLETGMEIEEGDQIKTSAQSTVDIQYDTFLLNHSRLEADTIATFESIEPTHIAMMDGMMFNILDGLPAGGAYEVATPTAVASVRGTVFAVGFNPKDKLQKTSVTHGNVRLYSFLDDQRSVDRQHSYPIRQGESIQLDYSPAGLDSLAGAAATAMDPSEIAMLQGKIDDSRAKLLQTQGGPQAFRSSLELWIKLKKAAIKWG